MEITLKDNQCQTAISINDDSLKTDGEIFIQVTTDKTESWHTIKNLKDFDDLIDTLTEFRKRMKKHLEE